MMSLLMIVMGFKTIGFHLFVGNFTTQGFVIGFD